MGTERGGCSRLMKTPRHNGGAVHSRSMRKRTQTTVAAVVCKKGFYMSEYLYTEAQVREMWKRTYEEQIGVAQAKAIEAIVRTDGEVVVSLSGGKDSAVMLYIVAQMWSITKYKDTKKLVVMFANTSNEFNCMSKYTTIDEQESVTAWDVLQKCLTTYRCECIIRSLTKTIDIYDRIGSDRGCYFMEGLNLRKISLKSDTYDFYTRIYPIGKDGITPEWLTGKDYIDDFQYSSKIKAYVWKDERYTNTTSLIEDATAKIEEMSRPYKAYTAEVVDLAKASEKYKDILSYGIGDTVTLVSKKTRTKEKQRIVKITEYPETSEKNTVEISNARKTFAEIQKEETAAATEEAISISNRATKKVLENYLTTEEIETKITASKEAVEAGVAYTLKNYYTSVQMDSLIKATKEEISQEVKHVEENSMHNYVVNGDFSNGLDDNWYNSNETNNAVMDVSGLGTVAKILKTSSSSSYIRQNLGKIPAGTYRVRYKAATAAGYESTARVQVGALGSYSTTSSGMLKSKEFTTIEREITVSEGTKYIYIYAYTQNAPVYITDIEVLGLYSLYADAKIQVTAEEITSEVNKKVNSDDFGTLITQNAYNVRIAFNKGSSYMQFDSTGITMYTGTITDNTKRTRFDYNGEHFYRDGKYVGKIGTNTMIGNGVHPGFLLFRYGGGLVHHCPVFRRCAPFLVVGKAVHFFCPAGGSFIDRVIVDGMHLLHASGHAGPKSYRSSWEGPALSFFGAGGAS